VKDMSPQTYKLAKLSPTIPVTSVPNEQSFSNLNKIKNYLRNIQGQGRLSSFSCLNIKSHLLDRKMLQSTFFNVIYISGTYQGWSNHVANHWVWPETFKNQHKYFLMQHSVQEFLRSVLFWDVTQYRMIVSCQHFRTNYQTHLQGPSTSWTALPLKMGPIGCLKMSVWNYHSMMHKISNEHRSNVHHSGSLKSIFLWWTPTQLNMIFTPPFW